MVLRIFDASTLRRRRGHVQRDCGNCPAVAGRCGFGAAYGKVSGSTRMPEVSLNGWFPPPANVSSTKNAVQPFSGAGTFATQVFGPLGVSGVLVYAFPILSCLKLRASGFVACHITTLSGRSFAITLIDPSCSNVHLICGRGVSPTIIA